MLGVQNPGGATSEAQLKTLASSATSEAQLMTLASAAPLQLHQKIKLCWLLIKQLAETALVTWCQTMVKC